MYCTPLFFLRESIYGRGRIQPRQLLKSLLLGVALMSFLGQDLYAQTESALRFDGTNDWIDIGSTTPAMPTGNSPWTAEAWVKTNQTNIGNFISWGTRATNQRAGIAVRGGKAAFIGQYNDVTGLGSSPAINDGEWHHVAVTYGGGASFDGQRNGVKIYVDGRQISAGGGARSPMNLVGQHFRIGNISQPSNGEYFRGDLDEVRIWNYARPVTEIIETKDKTLQGNEDGLIAYYNFNQDFTAATTTVPGAKTANNVAGTLKNMSPPVAAVSPPSLSTTSCNVQIGDNAFGGIVFYILQPGDPDYEAGKVKGLVASEEDLPGRYPYGCYGIEIPNLPTSNQVIKPGQLWYELPGLDIGEGSSNLQHILAAPCQTSGGVMTAAVACSQYGAGGFNDWYFPSIGESIKMYEQHAVINLDQTKSYLLSSTRSPHRDVYWTRPGGRVMLGMNDRRSNLYVRPIRKFTQVDNVAGTSTLSAELLPFGREGKPGTTDVKTDGTAKLEVMFAYFDGDPVPTLSPSTLWNTLTSNGDLTTKFQEQGLADITHNVSASTAWTKLDGAGTAYLTTGTNGNTWNYHKFFRDGYAKIPAPATAPVPPATQFDEYTIFVMITDKTAPVFSSVTSTATESEDDPGQLISSSVHASVGVFDGYDIADARGIRSNIVIAPNGDQDDYRLMMHEMGHNFGSPDLYPTEKTTVSLQGGGTEEKYAHEMGGFGMMGDMRAATGFLGWHRFRYGWLPENRTKLVREAGPQTYTLAKITDATASTNPKMIVIPDENHYAKQWVIEIAQDVKKRDEPAINTEGDRVIVYSVEEPAPTGKREIRLLFREPLSYHIDHNTTEWIEKVSFSEGQGFTQRENVPFTMQVLEKTANGFEICINIPRKLQGGQYPDDQTNGGYRLHFSSIGDVLVKEEPSGNFKWGARNNFFLSNQIDNTYIRLWQGNIQLVSKADQSVVDEIELDAPAGSVWYLTDEGKVQVKNPDGEVLWASHPANQTSPNGDFTLQFALDGNIQIRETANMAAYQWDLKSNRFTQSNSSGTYVALKDGNIQLISKDTQEMLEEIAVNAPEGSTWFITDEGKIQVKKPNGDVLWESHPANQTSPNGDFTLQFALDGNIQIRETASIAAYQWDLKSNRFTQSNSSGTYVALKDGNIQLISYDTQEMLEEIGVNAPEGSTWHITNEGKIQVKNPANQVLWASHPANIPSPDGAYTLQFTLDGNIYTRASDNLSGYIWDLRSRQFDNSIISNTYLALKAGNIQLINKADQQVADQIIINAPQNATWNMTNEGKVEVTNGGSVLWRNFSPNSTSPNGTKTISVNKNDGNFSIDNSPPIYGMQTLFPTGTYSGHYLTINAGKIQLINYGDQSVSEELDTGQPTGAIFGVDNAGKITVKDNAGNVVWTKP